MEKELNTYLYPLVSRCRNTNIITLAMFIPRQVLGPDPKGIKLYGFCISCTHECTYIVMLHIYELPKQSIEMTLLNIEEGT